MHTLVPPFIRAKFEQHQDVGCFSASTLMVDIVGFTAITESVMQYGQHGAEVLALFMRSVFTPLMQCVADQGGFVAMMAGDAFTAVFPTDQPEQQTMATAVQRALTAAIQIQARLRAEPDRVTPYGIFTVAAKLGIGAGEVKWMIWRSEDGRRAAYSFRGSAIEDCATAQRHASQGEIVLAPAAYQLRPAAAAAEPLGNQWRLTTSPLLPPLPAHHSPEPMRPSPQTPFFPFDLVTQPQTGEFRPIFNLFLGLPQGPDEHVLAAFIHSLFTLQDHYGGLLNRIDFGDKGCYLLLFWGAPVIHENDLTRVLTFLLELRRQSPLPFRAGLTYAIAHAGFIGSSWHEEYTCYGRGVNLAARFMTSAPIGDIWLDAVIARRAETTFALDSIGHHPFKGFAMAVPVYRLLAQKQAQVQFFRSHLIGRQEELERLVKFIQPILTGCFAGVATIAGEAGIGKSHLIHEALRQEPLAQACQVFVCQTDEILRRSLNPFRYWLRHYFDQSPTAPEKANKARFDAVLDELMAALNEPDLAAEIDRTRSFLGALVDLHWEHSLFEQFDAKPRFENTLLALKALLKAESRRRPVVLLLEDIHWLDTDSLAFIPLLTRNMANFPLAIMVTTRSAEASMPVLNLTAADMPQLELVLPSLSQADVGELATSFLKGRVTPELTTLLVERTGGNPFFIEQILLYLQEQEALCDSPNGWHLAEPQPGLLPLDVRAVLVARLDRLPSDVKQIVQTAAVLGREFALPPLVQMMGSEPELLAALKTAETAAIWVALSETHWIFKHALLHDAAYRMQLRSQRRDCHQRAVVALETLYSPDLTPYYEDLVHHAHQAADLSRERRYTPLAGEQALLRYSNDVALAYLRRALALETAAADFHPQKTVALHYGVGRILHRQAQYAAASAAFQAALSAAEAAHDQSGQLDAWLALSNILEVQGQHQAALDTVNRLPPSLLSLLPSLSLKRQAEMIHWRSWLHYRLGQLPLSLELSNQCLELCQGLDEPLLLIRTLKLLGYIHMHLGKHEPACDFMEKSRLLCQQHHLLREAGTLANALGELARLQGDFPRAVTLYKEALTIATEVGLSSDRLLFLSNLAGAQVGAADYETAVVNLQTVINEMEANWFNMPETYRFLAEAFLGLNQLDNALNAGGTSLKLALATGSPDLIGYGWQILGRVAARLGRPVVADGELHDATACFDKSAAVFHQAGMASDYAWTEYYRIQTK